MATVVIADKVYELTPLRIRESKAWREKFGEPFETILGVIQQAPGVELSDLTKVGKLLMTVSSTMIGSMELFREMVYDYSPEINADREYIEENGYDHEMITALLEVMKLAYPFGSLVTVLMGGQQAQQTSKS